MDAVFRVLNKALDGCRTFGAEEWAVIVVVAIVIGYLCLKGTAIR